MQNFALLMVCYRGIANTSSFSFAIAWYHTYSTFNSFSAVLGNSSSPDSPRSDSYLMGTSRAKQLVPKPESPSLSISSASLLSVSSQGSPAAIKYEPNTDGADPNKDIVIDSFTERLNEIRENRASKNTSRIFPIPKVGGISPTNRRAFEYKTSPEKTAIAKTGLTNSSSLWESKFPRKSQASNVQSISPRHLKKNRFGMQSNIGEHSNSRQDHTQVGVKTGSPKVGKFKWPESATASGLDDIEMAKDSSEDDDLPPVPPPPVPDFPPPDIELLPGPGMENGEETSPKTPPTVVTRIPVGPHSSLRTRQWTKAWQRRSTFLEDNMSEPLPLLIQSKVVENNKELEQKVVKDSSSSESIPSIPDYPPPMVPENPPPMLPDETEGGEIVLPEIPSSGPSPQRTPALMTKETQNHEQSASALPELASVPFSPPKENVSPPDSPQVFPSVPALPKMLLPASLPPAPPLSSLPNLLTDTEGIVTLNADSSTNLSTPRSERSTDDLIMLPNTQLSNFKGVSPSRTPDFPSQHTNTSTSAAESPTISVSSLHSSVCNKSKPSLLRPIVIEDDLMKSTSMPSFDGTSASLPALRAKPSSFNQSTRSMDYRNLGKEQTDSSPVVLRLPSMVVQHRYNQVKVISQGSPPISPDLKFTRVAKKTWKKPNHLRENDLSSSASTGNVSQGMGFYPDHIGPRTASLQSFGCIDSMIQHERHSYLKKLSPLTAMTGISMEDKPQTSSNYLDGETEMQVEEEGREHLPEAESASAASADNIKEQEAQVTGPLKRGRLDDFRRNARRVDKSPFGSFVLDSNLLDVSQIIL